MLAVGVEIGRRPFPPVRTPLPRESIIPFVKEAWYPAAMEHEIGSQPFHRKILGQDILLYRQGDGAPVALENVCPHRFVPLHLGEVVGDTIACGYHGLRFDRRGVCTVNPHGSALPGAKVESFPVVERHRMVWIWTGDKHAADPATIPPCSFIDRSETSVSSLDYMFISANYQLIMDNLLDLSHTDFLHKGSFGGNAGNQAKLDVCEDGDRIMVNRSFSQGNISPTLSNFTDYRGPVDRWQDICWMPMTVITLSTGATPAGRPREEGFSYLPWHILTPETETSTHVFIGKARNFNLDDAAMDARGQRDMRDPIYGEDKPMIEAQQAIIGTREFAAMRPALFGVDVGAVKLRRKFDRLFAAESTAAGTGA